MEYNLKFTQEEMQVLQAAIGEMPFRMAAPLVNSINAQIAATHSPNSKSKEQAVSSKRPG